MRLTSQDELERLSRYYFESDAIGRWTDHSPGTIAIHHERARAFRALVDRLPRPLGECSILDVGCGVGTQLALLASWGAAPERLAGIDLMEAHIAAARRNRPDIHFEVANAEELPFEGSWFDLACAFTIFSSLLDHAMAAQAAKDIARVLKPGGMVIRYDLRVNNPRNPNVRGLTIADAQGLFPGFAIDFASITLVPPLARMLGPTTPLLYPALAAIPLLRTHYFGTLQKPAP